MAVLGSAGSPTVKAPIASRMRRFMSSSRLLGTRRRVPAAQACPLFIKAMTRAAGIAWSSAASSSRIVGDLPPSSSVTRFIVAAPSRMIPSPTPTEPVKEILSTSGLRTSSAPTTSPRPITTLQTPLGSLAAVRHSIITCVCSELSSLGLITTVQPAPTADASLRQMNSAFAFQAVIKPATPTGSNVTVVLAQLRVKDRKSTRLNSSHPSISYAVFCLKKKKKTKNHQYFHNKSSKKKKKKKQEIKK